MNPGEPKRTVVLQGLGVSPGVAIGVAHLIRRVDAPISRYQQGQLGLAQAIVSQHLAKQRGANVVMARRDGVRVYYQLTEENVHHILQCIRTCDM